MSKYSIKKIWYAIEDNMCVRQWMWIFKAEILESSKNMKDFESYKNYLCKFSVQYNQNGTT